MATPKEANVSKVGEVTTPLPGVIASFREDVNEVAQWEVVPSVGDMGQSIDWVKHIMATPLDGDPYSQRAQLRNKLQLRSAPIDSDLYRQIARNYSNVGFEQALRLADAARINALTEQFASLRGLVNEPDGSEKTKGKRLATAGTARAWDQAVEYTVLNAGTKAFDSFCSGIRSVNSGWSLKLRSLSKIVARCMEEPADELGSTEVFNYGDGVTGPSGFRHSIYAARTINEYLSSGYKSPESVQKDRGDTDDKTASNYGEPDSYNPAPGIDPKSQPLDTSDIPDGYEVEHGKDRESFGKLIIDDSHRLTVEIKNYMKRKRKPMPYGRSISYPHRMLTDPQMRIFGSKRKVKGGVIVIDISGSMRLTDEDLDTFVESAPSSLILAYSDMDKGGGAPNAWILANRGWRVPKIPEDIGRSSNGVDGSALTWAIRHRKHGEPIIWVTDGDVTSIKGNSNDALSVICAKLVKKHKIIMIPSVEEAVRGFKSGKPLVNRPAGYVKLALLGHYTR